MRGINRKIFGWFTIVLSLGYFVTAFYQITMFFISEEMKKCGMSVLTFPLSLVFIAIGIGRIYAGRLLFKDICDKESFRFVFGLICFCEIAFGFIYGLALVEELGIIGNIIVLAFIGYYLISIPFLRRELMEN